MSKFNSTGSNKVYSHGHGGHGGSANDPSHIETSHLSDHTDYRDLNFRSIFQFMIGLFATVAVSYIAMYGMLRVFESEHQKNQPPLSAVADTAWTNPKPTVQIAPHVDLVKFRRTEDSVLAGIAANAPGVMPIEKAMSEVVAQGLPYRTEQQKNADIAKANGAAAPDTAATGSTAAAPKGGTAVQDTSKKNG